MIMNPQAGALGIDLRTASTMIWYSLTQSYVDYTQARDRIALSGKANRFVYLQATGTYDETQYADLQGDHEVIREIMASPEILLRGFK
jgi:archaellin